MKREPTIERLAIAQSLMLEPFGLSESSLAQALATIREHRVDDADLYFQTTRHEGWSLEEGIVKSGSFSIDQGVGVRAVAGEKTAFAYSDDLSEASLMDAARTVRTIAAAGQQRRIKVPARTKPAASRVLYAPTDPIGTLDSASKVALLEKVEKMARAKDPRIVQVMASVAAEHDVVLIARADGTRAADVRPLVRVNVTVIAEQAGRREVGSAGGGGRFGLGYFQDAVLQSYVDHAVDAALTNLDSRPAPAGEMTVVLGPGWPGVLLHEAVGHGLEGDFNRKGSSTFSGRIGQRVAAKGVTVLDDGTIADRRGSLNIDDEGAATQRNVLIEDGILLGYMQDALNARLMGVKPTGNGRRESYAHLPMPRMTNTYMLGGDRDPKEIVASLKRGIYATNFGGGQVDITSGRFVFSASQAWWVEDGQLKYPVKGATLIGNGPEAMNRVSMIGNDLQLDTGVGVCGKEGQSVPVGVGQPTLRIEKLTVGGHGLNMPATPGGVPVAVSLVDIETAAERLRGQVLDTPCVESRTLGQILGCRVFLKFENLQFTASFKERGALNKLAQLVESGEPLKGVVAASAGNHAQGVAHHAQRLGLRAVIVMPVLTPTVKVERTRGFGAEVVLHGETFDAAREHALQLAAEQGLSFVHPFDDPAVIAGQGTIGLEMLAEQPDLDTLVVAVGGGGLISGIATAARALKPGLEIVGVQTARFPAMVNAIKGTAHPQGTSTIAEGIAVGRPGQITRELIGRLVDDLVLVDEGDIEQAIVMLLEIEKTLVEGAGAAGLAALVKDPKRFAGRRVGLVLCGGNIDPVVLQAIIGRGLVRAGRLARIRVAARDTPGVLAKITAVVAQAGANIEEVHHQRAFSMLSAQNVEVELVLQTRNRAHVASVIDAMTATGFDASAY